MQKITSESELRIAIMFLESQQVEQGKQLKAQVQLAYESIKPINLAISALKEVATSSELQHNLFSTSVGVGAGYISKVLFQGVTNSPLRKLLGSALMFGITNLVTKNPDVLKSLVAGIFNMIRRKTHKEDPHDEENFSENQ